MKTDKDFQTSSLGTMPYGKETRVLTSDYPWTQISWNGQTGWVYRSFLTGKSGYETFVEYSEEWNISFYQIR
jgi:uncharacterized protein YraI